MNKRRRKKAVRKYTKTQWSLKPSEWAFIERLRQLAVKYKVNQVQEAYAIFIKQ